MIFTDKNSATKGLNKVLQESSQLNGHDPCGAHWRLSFTIKRLVRNSAQDGTKISLSSRWTPTNLARCPMKPAKLLSQSTLWVVWFCVEMWSCGWHRLNWSVQLWNCILQPTQTPRSQFNNNCAGWPLIVLESRAGAKREIWTCELSTI